MFRLLIPVSICLAGAAVNAAAHGPAAASHASVATALSEQSGLCDLEEEWRAQFRDPDLVCVSTDHGAAIARPEQAEALAGAMNDAYIRFARHFTASDKRIAVVARQTFSDEQSAFLEESGYLPLPWLDDSSRSEMQQQEVRRQVEEQASMLPEAQREAIIAQALAQLPASSAEPRAPDQTELGAASHEAGHFFFRDLFDVSESAKKNEIAYGSSAPDWLDEMAAVLAENEELTAGRYTLARREYAAGKRVPAYPLAQYLTMDHPSLIAAQLLMERLGKDGDRPQGTITLTGEDAERFLAESAGGDPVQFYVQSRLFADYMIEKTDDPKIFYSVVQHFRQGGSLESWLADQGARRGLPVTLTALQSDWDEWTARRLAPD